MVTDEPSPSLVEALTEARAQPPWNAGAVLEYGQEPDISKRNATACHECEERPCRNDEICATMLVRELGLSGAVGRDQAFHLVESGMKRVRLQGRAAIREEDGPRPNTFVELSNRSPPEAESHDDD